jgi:hypothetical protein
VNHSLRAAFRATFYRFDVPDAELLLKVGEPSMALAGLLRNRGANCAAVITAFNPQAQSRSAALNRAAQEQLLNDLRTAGYACVAGRNEDPAGQWPVEESLLVLGLDLETAQALATRYGQVAFLWMDASTATPRLVETAAAR